MGAAMRTFQPLNIIRAHSARRFPSTWEFCVLTSEFSTCGLERDAKRTREGLAKDSLSFPIWPALHSLSSIRHLLSRFPPASALHLHRFHPGSTLLSPRFSPGFLPLLLLPLALGAIRRRPSRKRHGWCVRFISDSPTWRRISTNPTCASLRTTTSTSRIDGLPASRSTRSRCRPTSTSAMRSRP